MRWRRRRRRRRRRMIGGVVKIEECPALDM